MVASRTGRASACGRTIFDERRSSSRRALPVAVRGLRARWSRCATWPTSSPQHEWPCLNDAEVLAANEVPMAAAIDAEDLYVERVFSEETVATTPNVHGWVTSGTTTTACASTANASWPPDRPCPWTRLSGSATGSPSSRSTRDARAELAAFDSDYLRQSDTVTAGAGARGEDPRHRGRPHRRLRRPRRRPRRRAARQRDDDRAARSRPPRPDPNRRPQVAVPRRRQADAPGPRRATRPAASTPRRS